MQFKVSLQQQSLREYDGVELNLCEDIQMSTVQDLPQLDQSQAVKLQSDDDIDLDDIRDLLDESEMEEEISD